MDFDYKKVFLSKYLGSILFMWNNPTKSILLQRGNFLGVNILYTIANFLFKAFDIIVFVHFKEVA